MAVKKPKPNMRWAVRHHTDWITENATRDGTMAHPTTGQWCMKSGACSPHLADAELYKSLKRARDFAEFNGLEVVEIILAEGQSVAKFHGLQMMDIQI